MSGADASYDFANVTLRLACVTVKKSGFLTKRQCRQVDQPGELNYNSVAMFEGTDAIDAGVTDATTPDIDAATTGDGGGDGGNGATGPGGGCCDAGRDGTGSSVMLAVLSAWFLRRRRGTTESRT